MPNMREVVAEMSDPTPEMKWLAEHFPAEDVTLWGGAPRSASTRPARSFLSSANERGIAGVGVTALTEAIERLAVQVGA